MKYMVLQIQKGKGCNYTIGCGTRVFWLDAKSKDEAIKEVLDLPDNWKDLVHECGSPEELIINKCSSLSCVDPSKYYQFEEIMLIEVSDQIDMIPILKKEFDNICNYYVEFYDKKLEEAELKELERLRKKFNK